MFLGWRGDSEQYMWYLGWFWHAVAAGSNPLLTTGAFNYPAGINLMWNTSLVAPAVLLGLLSHLFNLVFTYNLLTVVNLGVSFVLAELILRKLGVRGWLAQGGAVMVGLTPYITAQMLGGHIILTTTGAALGVVYLLAHSARAPINRPLRFGGLLGLLVAIQFYTSLEILTMSVLVAGIAVFYCLALCPFELRQWYARLPRTLWLSAATVAIVLMLPGLYLLFYGPYRPTGWLQPGNTFVTDLLNFVIPTRVLALSNGTTNAIAGLFTGNLGEENGYLGLPAIVLLAWALFQFRQQRLAKAFFLTGITICFLSMGPFLHVGGYDTKLPLPWLVFEVTPVLYDILPSRLMFYVDLGTVITIVTALEAYLKTTKRWLPFVLSLGSILLVTATWFPALPFTYAATPNAGAAIAPGGSLYPLLRGQPTFILTSDFPQVMVSLAEGGYAFPVVNVYGHNANSRRRIGQLTKLTCLLGNPAVPHCPGSGAVPSFALARQVLLESLPGIHARMLLFFPLSHGVGKIPSVVEEAITSLMGPPVARAGRAFLWRVPPKLSRVPPRPLSSHIP